MFIQNLLTKGTQWIVVSLQWLKSIKTEETKLGNLDFDNLSLNNGPYKAESHYILLVCK